MSSTSNGFLFKNCYGYCSILGNNLQGSSHRLKAVGGAYGKGRDLFMNGTCPKCGSGKITQIDRMNGYLGITRKADGTSRYNDAKLAEIAERKSM